LKTFGIVFFGDYGFRLPDNVLFEFGGYISLLLDFIEKHFSFTLKVCLFFIGIGNQIHEMLGFLRPLLLGLMF
jgi:hypothetical protein